MLKKKKNNDTLEYYLGRIDRTNPILFKEKNEFFFQNADSIITSEQKSNKKLFIDLLGCRFPNKDYQIQFDTDKNRFVIPEIEKKNQISKKEFYRNISHIPSKNKEIISPIREEGHKTNFLKFSSFINNDKQVRQKVKLNQDPQNNIRFIGPNSSKPPVNPKTDYKANSCINSTNVSFFSGTKMFSRKSSEVFNEKLLINKGLKITTQNRDKIIRSSNSCNHKYFVNSNSQKETNKDGLNNFSKTNSYFHKIKENKINNIKFNHLSKSNSDISFTNIPDKNQTPFKTNSNIPSPANQNRLSYTFRSKDINYNIKEKVMKNTIINKDFINNLKEFSKLISERNKLEIKSVKCNEDYNTERIGDQRRLSKYRLENMMKKTISSSKIDKMNNSMINLGFSKDFKKLKKIKSKSALNVSDNRFKTLWLQKKIQSKKPLTKNIKNLDLFDRLLNRKLQKEEIVKNLEKAQFNIKKFIFPGFKSRIEKAYEVFEIDEKTKHIINSMCKDIFGYEENDLDQRLREIKFSVLKKKKDNFPEKFQNNSLCPNKNQKSKEMAGTLILNIPNHFPENYSKNWNETSGKKIFNKEFLMMRKSDNMNKELFYTSLSKKSNNNDFKAKTVLKNSNSIYETCENLALDNKSLKNDILMRTKVLSKSSLYLDPSWCICADSKNIDILEPHL
jgi:hypothetical protein